MLVEKETPELENKELRAKLEKIEIKHMDDESPDVSYLETTASSHFGKDGENWHHVSTEDRRKAVAEYGTVWDACIAYAEQDKRRLEAFNRGEWHMIGIKAVATINIPLSTKGSFIRQTIQSGGLWGIESDSDESYLKEVEKDQIEEVKGYLKILNVEME